MGRKQKIVNKIEEVFILHIPVKYCSLIKNEIEREPIDFSQITGYNEPEMNENFHLLDNNLPLSQPLFLNENKEEHLNRSFVHCNINDNSNKNIQTSSISYNILHDFNCVEYGKWPDKTNVHCWWCCHPFDTIPIPIPFSYSESTEIFKVKGCFCSFNCVLSYAESKGMKETYLIKYMYKKLTGKSGFCIQKAPPREMLKIFGGPLNVDEYRKSFNDTCCIKYNMIEYPMVAYNDQIEEVKKRVINNSNTKVSLSETRVNSAKNKVSTEKSINNAIPKMGGVVKTKLSDFFSNINDN